MVSNPRMISLAIQMAYDPFLLHKQRVVALKDFMAKLYGSYNVQRHRGRVWEGE